MRIPPRPDTTWQFNPPPGWPPVPVDWEPTEGWGGPDEDWPAAPPYWNWWIVPDDVVPVVDSAPGSATPGEQHETGPEARKRSNLLVGALTGVVVLVLGALVLWSSSEREPGGNRDSSTATDDSSITDGGGATGADLAYETEWTTTRTRQVHIQSPACSAVGFSEADCLANPGRWASEPYSVVQRGFVCAADLNEASKLATMGNVRLTGEITDKAC